MLGIYLTYICNKIILYVIYFKKSPLPIFLLPLNVLRKLFRAQNNSEFYRHWDSSKNYKPVKYITYIKISE